MTLALILVLAVPPPPVPAGVAWVRAENDGAGAGFVIDAQRKLLVTCRHVVADRKKVDVIFPWVRGGELVTDRAAYLGDRVALRELGLLVSATVLKTSDDLDLALLELDSLPSGEKAVALAAHAPEPGEPLRVIGNRLDLDTVWNTTTGPLRSRGWLADGYFWRGKKLAENANVLIGQLPTEEGDSGGPVFDSRGELVGMASALRRQCLLAAVCIDASEIRTFAGLPGPGQKEKPKASPLADALVRATVWVRPTATDVHLAGVLVEHDLVVTCAKGLTTGDCVGIAFPVRDGGKWNHDRALYRDPVGLALGGYWRGARVLACDRGRDLALLRLESPVAGTKPVPLADHPPEVAAGVHAMSHPGGLEFAWVYAGGTVRQRGAVVVGESAGRTTVLVCQLPAQTGSPGGPVVNDRGELVGVLSRKESVQMVGYAVTTAEVARFLDVSLHDRPPRTLAGLVARVENLPDRLTRAAALGLARHAERHRTAGETEPAIRDARAALALDPVCVAARLCLARILPPAEALAELDAAVERGAFDRDALRRRADLAANEKDWRKARADLERVLDANPADADARQRLVPVLLELNKDVEAATAVGDTLRADPKRLAAVAADLLTQAESMAKKYPDAPSVPASWLLKAMTATKRPEFADALTRVAAAKDDMEKLGILRAGLNKMTGK